MSDNAASADTISGIIAELSEVLAFSRSRWQKFACEVEPDLTGADFILLSTISRKGPITAKELCELLAIDKAAVSRSITRLRELDLVAAAASADDGRVQLLSTTSKANAQLDQIRQKWAQAYHERFAGWDAESLESLRDGLHRFNESGR